LGSERLGRDGAQREHDDLSGEYKVGADRTLNFVLFILYEIYGFVFVGRDQLFVMFVIRFLGVEEFVQNFFCTLKTEVGTADHHEGRNEFREKIADGQCRWHEN
jgi:hypothetical protein